MKRSVNANYDTHFVRISYQSLVTPKFVFLCCFCFCLFSFFDRFFRVFFSFLRTSFQCLVTPKFVFLCCFLFHCCFSFFLNLGPKFALLFFSHFYFFFSFFLLFLRFLSFSISNFFSFFTKPH